MMRVRIWFWGLLAGLILGCAAEKSPERQADPDPLTRDEALSALAQIGDIPQAAFPLVRDRMTDEKPFVRARAASALGELRLEPEQSVAALRTALKDSDSQVRRNAISALAEFETQAGVAVQDLLPMLSEQDASLKYFAIEALGRIGPTAKSSLPQLMALAQPDSGSSLRRAAQMAVWNIDPNAAQAANLPEPPAARAEKPPRQID